MNLPELLGAPAIELSDVGWIVPVHVGSVVVLLETVVFAPLSLWPPQADRKFPNILAPFDSGCTVCFWIETIDLPVIFREIVEIVRNL